ncbi:NAD(P)-binding protein [Ascodesmis nigricans]|uniref:NAD(P)-binding protein n=1 Tax=Ascodesmis nigricans TaxID=341454 RepID=A0A4S2MT50_9PEZI|nr:NAD(P)-binding protein [Ascodesmis nigricans]
MASLFDLSGKTAAITGCTRGIGQQMAIALAEAGADVVLIQRDTTNTTTHDSIKELGRQVYIITCDLSSSTEASMLVSRVVEAAGKVDILVNAAGIQRRHPAHQFPEPDWNEVLQINLSTVFTLCRDIAAHWIASSSHGRIINVASLLSFQGGFTVPAYTAAKHAVVGITKSFANEWASKGIAVNAIAPGYIATDMNEALMKDATRSRQIMERIPQARWGKPEDFKGPCVFLASEKASSYVNGECLVVDGGWMGR